MAGRRQVCKACKPSDLALFDFSEQCASKMQKGVRSEAITQYTPMVRTALVRDDADSTDTDINPWGRLMNNEVPIKYYDIADEYATESATAVSESERDSLARYFELLLARLMNNEEISEEAQQEMASEAGINAQRIDEIATFLNQWGNE